MYGKVMSIPDKAMGQYFRLVTRWTPDEIDEIEDGLITTFLHPRDVKMKLAHEIVSIYHSTDAPSMRSSSLSASFSSTICPMKCPNTSYSLEQTVLEVLVSPRPGDKQK